jgi:hypothetical protein
VIHIARTFFIISLLTVTGCSGAQPSLPQAFNNAQSLSRTGRSWMDPAAKSGSLVYVASGLQVNIYSWPKLHLVGALTGFVLAIAACVDSTGHVWIVDGFTLKLFKFAHGGTNPTATLDDAPNSPQSCAVDRADGDVAVGNDYNTRQSEGSVTLFRHAKEPGTPYYERIVAAVNGLDYGPDRKLYVSGSYGGSGALAVFRGATFTPVTIQGVSLASPGGVQYVKGALTVADGGTNQRHAVVYHISADGTVLGETALRDAYNMFQYHIVGDKLLCGCYEQHQVQLYNYPSGGTARKIKRNRHGLAWGVVLSPPG